MLGILEDKANDQDYRFLPLKAYLAHRVYPPPGANRWIADHLQQLQKTTIKALGLEDDQFAATEE